MSDAYSRHADFCAWHEHQRDADCRCSVSRSARVAAASAIAFGERSAHGVVKPGWYRSRSVGHDGPCAAWPVSHDAMPGWEYRPRTTPSTQSRADSFMEALTNIAIGLVISTIANAIVLPAVLGVRATLGQNVAIGVIFTAISLARSYALRRAFNGRSVWAALKGRFA